MCRPATAEDLPAITEIYNHYIVDSHVSFDAEPWSLEQRQAWWTTYQSVIDAGEGPWLAYVAVDDDGRVLGASWSSRYRTKAAYDSSVETTIVFHPDAVGRGLGAQLYGTLLAELDRRGVHRQYAIVALPNDASIDLHRRMGFTEQAVQDEVGFKDGRYWSTMLLQRIPGGDQQRAMQDRRAVRDQRFNAIGYGMWLVGCVLFGLVAWRSQDLLSFAASVLFFAGVAAVMVPVFGR